MKHADVVLEIVRGLPPRARIPWGSTAFSLRTPFTRSFDDVYAEAICRPADLMWAWTVEQLGSSTEIADPLSLPTDYDAQLEMLVADPRRGGTPNKARLQLDDGRVLDLGHLLDDSEWADYRAASDDWRQQRTWYWQSWQELEAREFDGRRCASTAARADLDGETWIVRRVWTPAAINRAVEAWCAGIGRGDLSFRWNPTLRTPEDELIAQYEAGAEAIRRGDPAFEEDPTVRIPEDELTAEYEALVEMIRRPQAELTTIADGDRTGEPVMEWLLSLDPAVAGQILRRF